MAVVTAANVIAAGWLRGVSGSGLDTILGTLITTAEDRLARLCGFVPATATGSAIFDDAAYTLYLDSPGGEVLDLPFGPVVSITTIHDDPLRVYGSDTLVASTDYAAFNDRGPQVILKSTSVHGSFSKAERALKVVATLGFETPPQAIKDAVGCTVGFWAKDQTRLGNASGQGVTFKDTPIPKQALVMLAPYRSLRMGFA